MMSSGKPDTCVKQIHGNLRPCLLQLSGELFDAENCLQLLGALLQNRSEGFSGTGLCAVPRSNISHPEKEQVVATRCMTARDRLRAWDIIFFGLLI